MRNTMMHDKQVDQQPQGRPVMRAKILRYSATALLFLGVSVFQGGQAQALINDHRSPDGTCQGVPEPPGPASGCEAKICTNDGDWMCCNRCTPSGGYCCEQIVTMSRHPQGLRPPSGFGLAPLNVQPSTTPQPPRSTLPGGVMRRGVEGDQSTEPASGNEVPGCTCKGGSGTCTIDTVGTSTCYKAQGNTCTGQCGWGSLSRSGNLAPQ